MKDLMIDIETLGLRADSVVLAVGLCVFDLKSSEIGVPMEYVLELDSYRHIDPNTVCWWMKQTDEARQRYFNPTERVSASLVQDNLRGLMWGCGIERVWSHGFFDMAVLRDLFDQEPWHYRMVRDTRTLAMLAPGIEAPAPRIKHVAMWDAEAQAIWMQHCYRRIMCLEGQQQ